MSVLSVGLSITLLLADAAGQPARTAQDLHVRLAPRASVPRVNSSKATLFLTVMPWQDLLELKCVIGLLLHSQLCQH